VLGCVDSNLLYAYQASLKMIVEGSPSLEERFKLHIEASDRLKGEIERLGLKQVRFTFPPISLLFSYVDDCTW
jgi:aspartate aminotransferase-like enzyme